MGIEELFRKLRQEEEKSESPDSNLRDELAKFIQALTGYAGGWSLSRGMMIPHNNRLSHEGKDEFKSAFKRLGDKFVDDLEAEAKRIFGDNVLTRAEVDMMVNAALAASKAAAPQTSGGNEDLSLDDDIVEGGRH